MIRRFLKEVLLRWNPPKKGDVYMGDSFDFIIGKPLEAVLHGTRDKFGEPTFYPVPGDETYRIDIEMDVGSYYVCKCRVLVEDPDDRTKRWLDRSQARRWSKETLLSLILDGVIEKQEKYFTEGSIEG